MTLLYRWNIFDKTLSYNFYKPNLFSLIIWFKVKFIHFTRAFALVSVRISSLLNSRLSSPPPMVSAVSYYNNKNMRFIRYLLANQIAYIFRSNDKANSICESASTNYYSINKSLAINLLWQSRTFIKYLTALFIIDKCT